MIWFMLFAFVLVKYEISWGTHSKQKSHDIVQKDSIKDSMHMPIHSSHSDTSARLLKNVYTSQSNKEV